MVRIARRSVRGSASGIRFVTGHVDQFLSERFDVVSASSFLAVVPDVEGTIQHLWSVVSPGGYLVVIEPTERMNPEAARDYLNRHTPGRRAFLLRRWASARDGRAVDLEPLRRLSPMSETHEYLDGMVVEWIVRKPAGEGRSGVA
jgi:2-polyprenyl-3-methyl-5-hydroxy-6-metoxy-1,4-benzoquinol methylase